MSIIKMKKAVVTGSNGFIGSYLVESLLSKGYFVYGVGRGHSEKPDSDSFKFIDASFDEYPSLVDKIKGPIDYFFHLAWAGNDGIAFKNFALQLSNINSTAVACECAIDLKCKKFLMVSTINIVELLKGYGPENPRFTTIYSASKFAAESVCRTLCYKAGIEFNCPMLPMIYGPKNRGKLVPNVVIKTLLKGESPKLIKGEGLYDLVYVGDAAEGIIAIAENGISPKRYYLGHNKLRTFKSIFTEVGEIINPSIKLDFGAYPEENSIDYSLVDLEELKKDTGFEPTANFKETILATAEYLKEVEL